MSLHFYYLSFVNKHITLFLSCRFSLYFHGKDIFQIIPEFKGDSHLDCEFGTCTCCCFLNTVPLAQNPCITFHKCCGYTVWTLLEPAFLCSWTWLADRSWKTLGAVSPPHFPHNQKPPRELPSAAAQDSSASFLFHVCFPSDDLLSLSGHQQLLFSVPHASCPIIQGGKSLKCSYLLLLQFNAHID